MTDRTERTRDVWMAIATDAAHEAVMALIRVGNDYADQHPEPDEDGFVFTRQSEEVSREDPRVRALATVYYDIIKRRT